MGYFTAQQITDVLKNSDININLRTVRYYTQIGMVPPLQTVGKRRVYTDVHLAYFRAILTLAKMGETLATIREELKDQSIDEIKKIGDQITLYQSNKILNRETTKINDDAFIILNSRINPETKQKIFDSISEIMKEDGE
ncbi:MerR family transcriptional regulator [Sporolactobacillus pectinivorans]|uniref:MerR family transcriptional regulator n=1 Tax=Sporolactobacillus pectinivorans TaxID=1591408 RepID=UPI000C26942A|nr:MerR family transcriptional regulator [Sporolactobacillus pectinivorans]